MPGRKPKPTALKVLHGDFEKNPQRRNKREPKVDAKCPTCPRWIKGEARREWKRLGAELASLKVISSTDRSGLEQYCITYQKWRESLAIIEAEGSVVNTPHGPKEHPHSRLARAHAELIHKMLAQFGMTPSARSRLCVTEETPAPRMRRVR